MIKSEKGCTLTDIQQCRKLTILCFIQFGHFMFYTSRPFYVLYNSSILGFIQFVHFMFDTIRLFYVLYNSSILCLIQFVHFMFYTIRLFCLFKFLSIRRFRCRVYPSWQQ